MPAERPVSRPQGRGWVELTLLLVVIAIMVLVVGVAVVSTMSHQPRLG